MTQCLEAFYLKSNFKNARTFMLQVGASFTKQGLRVQY